MDVKTKLVKMLINPIIIDQGNFSKLQCWN
jgi:hypothetical protein